MDASSQPATLALHSRPPVLDKGLVLVVDDHEATLYAVTRMLQSRGFRTMGASSGQHAITALRTLVPTFAVIDANMPDMDGLDLLSWIKSQHHLAKVPVVLCSAGLTPAKVQRGLELGAIYVQKLDPHWFELPKLMTEITPPSMPSNN